MRWTEDGDELDKTHSGCISSIFHVLDYEYWNSSVKKILPHRKLDNRAKRNRRHQRISHDQDPLELLKLLDTETSHILVDKSNTKTSSTLKNSVKTQVKAIFKDDNHSPRLQRAHAVNRLETNEWVHPIVFFPENVNSDETPVSSKDRSNVTNSEIKDVLEIFKVNKEVFVKILQHDSRVSEKKAKLTKSGSFPVAYKSGTRNLKPTKHSISRNDKELSSSNSASLLDDNLIRIRRISSLNESAERRSVSTEITTRLRCSQEEISGTEFQIMEGLESSNNPQENLENEIKNAKHTESTTKHHQDADDFTYVKQILDQSGFIKNGSQQKWYSSNQPLDPFVFQQIESQYSHDPNHFAQDFKELSHRLLIFDLVDDILLHIYERSLPHYPKAFSSSCHIRPCVLDEVWKRVNQFLNLKPDMNQSLDSIVSKDLGTDDWMNLQMNLECVGIELEDLILDDVLEEVLFECSLIERVVS